MNRWFLLTFVSVFFMAGWLGSAGLMNALSLRYVLGGFFLLFSSRVTGICKLELEFDLLVIGFSAVLALGGIKVLFSSFDDDDDDEDGGMGSPVYEPSFIGSAA